MAGIRPLKGKNAIAAPRNVIGLMDVLRASIKAEEKPRAGAEAFAAAKKRA